MNIIPDVNKGHAVSTIEIEQVQQEQKEYILLGTFLLTKGLRLFCYDHLENEVFEITIKYSDTIHLYLINRQWVLVDWEAAKCSIDSKFIHFEALNLKSAEKRVARFKEGKIKELFNLRKPSKEGIKFY